MTAVRTICLHLIDADEMPQELLIQTFGTIIRNYGVYVNLSVFTRDYQTRPNSVVSTYSKTHLCRRVPDHIFHMLSKTLSPAYHLSLLPACSSNRGPPGALLARASLACPALARLPGLARFLDNVPPWLVVLAAGFVSAPRNKVAPRRRAPTSPRRAGRASSASPSRSSSS